MNTDKMRAAIAANPQWNSLDVIRECLGVEPSTTHKSFFVDDRRTAEGIPDQIDRHMRHWNDAFPVMKMPVNVLASLIQVNQFDSSDTGFSKRTTIVQAIKGGDRARTWLEKAEFWPVHPVVESFRRIVGRDPTQEALDWYMNDWTVKDYSQSQLEAAIRSGMNAAARQGQLRPGQT